jgi:nucleoid DNA-binding protein
VTKNDLVNAVANHGLSKRQSSSVVESVFDIIFRCFEKGEDVKIVGFGHFRIRRKASRRGRNPQTASRSRSRRARCSRSSQVRGSNNGSIHKRRDHGSRGKALLPHRGGRGDHGCPRVRPSLLGVGIQAAPAEEESGGSASVRPRDLELVQRIKTLLYDERLTLEGAKKRLIAESRRTDQLEFGMKETAYADALRRIRDRLGALRTRLGS